ncbi:MAG: thioredoxin domain-containing protein [Bacteroidota bacterium]
MKKKLKIIFKIIILLPALTSCQNGNHPINTDYVVAYIDSLQISIKQVDIRARQEIYDELNRVYLIRKIALEEILREKLLGLEATKYNLTIEKLIDSIYYMALRHNKLQRFISENHYSEGIPAFERTLKYYEIQSEDGNNILHKRFKEYILKNYIDSLKLVYKTRVLLEPPIPPNIKITNLLVHYRGNLKSKTNCIIISDFECEMCRKYNPLFDSLYIKYKDKVKFGFTNFGSYATISAIATECAAKQGKFWEMHDALFSLSDLPDTTRIFSIAYDLDININEFKNDFYDKKTQNAIENNLNLIINSGIYATPTIMINNRPIFNSSSIVEIEQLLLNTLSSPDG